MWLVIDFSVFLDSRLRVERLTCQAGDHWYNSGSANCQLSFNATPPPCFLLGMVLKVLCLLDKHSTTERHITLFLLLMWSPCLTQALAIFSDTQTSKHIDKLCWLSTWWMQEITLKYFVCISPGVCQTCPQYSEHSEWLNTISQLCNNSLRVKPSAAL